MLQGDTPEYWRGQAEYYRERIARYGEVLEEAKAELAKAEEELVALTPPFQVGDTVHYDGFGPTFPNETVQSIGRVGSKWIVFVENDACPYDASSYTKVEPTFPREGARWRRKEPGMSGPDHDQGTIGQPTTDGFMVNYDRGITQPLSRRFIEEHFEEAA